MAVPFFTAAAVLAASSDCIACLPERLVEAMAKHLPLRVPPLPFPCPEFESHLFWHARTASDPPSRIFCQIVVDALSAQEKE